MADQPATRDELNALGESLRKALESDRGERIEILTRMETKMDARLESLFNMLQQNRDHYSDLNARVGVLEDGFKKHLGDAERNFEAVANTFNTRLTDHQNFYNAQLNQVRGKLDRNWGWIMGIFGAVAMAIFGALVASYFKG